MISLTKALMVI